MAEPDATRLAEAARRWAATDPDPTTAAEAVAMAERGDPAELDSHFGRRLAFGTAGLRAALGPGPNRMNRVVVRQCAAGVARVLLEHDPELARTAGVVVGRDARRGSEQFAADATEVLSAHGLPVHVLDGPSPTPLAAFALRHLDAAAAIVVTASHNPPADNGVKVYWSDGAQIVPPVDTQIAAAIEDVAAGGLGATGADPAGAIRHLGEVAARPEVVRAYVREAASLVPGSGDPVPLAVTSLHGVGADLLDAVLTDAGFGPVHHVASQREPDASFPTVEFPNPEEPGALDELLDLARSSGAVLAIANDPDADRLALAAPGRDGWRALTGDETAAVLADHLLGLTEDAADRLLVTTVVSSRLLSAMAAEVGAHFVETLTGFKWLCRPALENPGWTQVLAYEEALGYAVGPAARDKDGITAALVAADAAAALGRSGRTVWDVLDDLARRHGAHVTSNGSTRLGGPGALERMATLAAGLTAEPPTALGGLDVVGTDRPAPDVLRMWLEDHTRVVLRPSGTEPKFKHYCEAVEAVSPAEHPDRARERASARLAAVVADVGDLVTAS